MSGSGDDDTAPGLSGRTVVITGASDGVGAAIARGLAGSGARLVVIGRSPDKTRAVGAEVGAAVTLTADFSRLEQVRTLAGEIHEQVGAIDVLVNNAGGLFDCSQATADGYESNVQINHLAPFLLTNLLRDRLAADGGALVVNTSSVGNLFGRVRPQRMTATRPSFLRFQSYCASKLMNILFTRGIRDRWSGDGVVAVAVHPGGVASSFAHDLPAARLVYDSPLTKYALITPQEAAGPFLDLIGRGADPALTGRYFHRARPDGPTSPQARDRRLADELWAESARLVGLDTGDHETSPGGSGPA